MIFSQFKLAIYAAIAVAALSGVFGIYMKGRIDANHAAELANQREVILLLGRQKERAEKAAKEDAEKLAEAEAALAAYEILVTEIEHETQDAGRECLDAADVERLRKLFEGKPR